MIPTVEVSQCFFMMDVIIGSGLKYDESNLENKHFRALGPSGVGKSFAVNAFLKRVNGDARF
jgi:putative ribosome biogenesis GTPase RsgA